MILYVYLKIGVFRLCSTSPSLYLCILSIVHTADLSMHMRSTLTRFRFARFRLANQWIWWTVKEQIPTSDFQYLWQVMYYSLQYFSILNILEPDVPVCLGHRQAVHNIDPLGAAEHCHLTTMGPELTLWKFVACGCLWLGRGSTSWQCVLANHQQRSTSKTFTDHLCLIHLFPPSIFNFVFDFFRLTSFQVLLLDIFGGFIMAVASEARSIEDRSWQIELTLWVDASLPSSMSQGCRYSFWLVRLQGFACFASIRKCLASELFWSLTCRNHHWMTGWDSFARSPPSVMTTKHWQLSERFPPFRPLVPFLVLLRHGLIWLDPRLRALRAPLVWLEVISVKLRIQGGLPLCLCL